MWVYSHKHVVQKNKKDQWLEFELELELEASQIRNFH